MDNCLLGKKNICSKTDVLIHHNLTSSKDRLRWTMVDYSQSPQRISFCRQQREYKPELASPALSLKKDIFKHMHQAECQSFPS